MRKSFYILITFATLTGASHARLPLSFEPHAEQFVARGEGYRVWLTPTETVLELPADVVRSRLVGANPNARPTGLAELPGRAHYLLGNDPTHWRTDVPLFARVRYADVYRGIDLVYYGHDRQLEYDFIVQPGGDPRAIRLTFDRPVRLVDGVLHVGAARWRAPVARQGDRVIPSRYVLRGRNEVGFQVGRYDRRQPLVIDPVLEYATYLGGTAFESALAAGTDATGNLYVAGNTRSLDFPVTPNAFQTNNPVIIEGNKVNGFVAKLDPTGTQLVYATYFGGVNNSGATEVHALAVETNGAVWLTGATSALQFPTTTNAFDSTLGGIGYDVFVSQLNPAGNGLLYSTFLGGGGNHYDEGNAIAVHNGRAVVAGNTSSPDFPTTPGVFNEFVNNTDAFVAVFDPAATNFSATLVWCGALGGSSSEDARAVAVASNGVIWVTGETSSFAFPVTSGAFQTNRVGTSNNGFITAISQDGANLLFSSYLGGSRTTGQSVQIHPNGLVYVAGTTDTSNFPLSPAPFSATPSRGFLFVFDPDTPVLPTVIHSTYLPGAINPQLVLDRADRICIGSTVMPNAATNLPVTADALFSTARGGTDLGLTVFDPTISSVAYGTFFGGTGNDSFSAITRDRFGNLYLIGNTESPSLPATSGTVGPTPRGGQDAVVAKFFLPVPVSQATPPGMNVPAEFLVPVGVGEAELNLTFTQVTGAGTTTVTALDSLEPLPAGFFVFNGLALDVSTTATVTGPIELCFHVPEANDLETFNKLRVLHWEDGAFVDRTLMPADFAARTICAVVDALSPFVVAVYEPTPRDLAVLSLKAPKKVTLQQGKPPKPGKISITIQNLGATAEVIPDADTLVGLVGLTIESLGDCAAPVPQLVPPKSGFPITLAPKKKLKVDFTVVIDCTNDAVAGFGHEDYRHTVTLGGDNDTNPTNNVCPRPPSGADKGCNKGLAALTDVIVK